MAVDFGYMLVAAIALFGYGGYWLDKKYDTAPLLLMAGVILGIATAFQSLFRRLRRAEQAEKAARQAGQKPGGTKNETDPPPR